MMAAPGKKKKKGHLSNLLWPSKNKWGPRVWGEPQDAVDSTPSQSLHTGGKKKTLSYYPTTDQTVSFGLTLQKPLRYTYAKTRSLSQQFNAAGFKAWLKPLIPDTQHWAISTLMRVKWPKCVAGSEWKLKKDLCGFWIFRNCWGLMVRSHDGALY